MQLLIEKEKYGFFSYALMGIMLAFGIVLQIADSFISFGVPGGKLGLANVITVINVFLFGGINAVVVSSLRAFLGCVLSGAVSAVPYSVLGVAASAAAMALMKKCFYPKVSETGISVTGACVHNLAQIAVACVIFENTAIISYGTVLISVGIVSGIITGIIARQLFEKLGLKKYSVI